MPAAGDRPAPPDPDDVLAGLSYAVFGFPSDPQTGLLGRMIRLENKLDQLRHAAYTAALSFAAGSIAVSLTIVLA